jgi:magnesium-protoporphyrin IX monomethyl ester (oxidative) cyclase
MKLALVNMPFASVERPSLALSLIKDHMEAEGHDVKVFYPNIEFSELIGLRLYYAISNSCDVADLVGEWFFSEVAFNDKNLNDGFLEDYLSTRPFSMNALSGYLGTSEKAEIFERLRHAKSVVISFLDELTDSILVYEPDVVACTSVFQQNLSSASLLRKVKAADSSIKTILGGANCEGVMGDELRRILPWVDVVHSGRIEGSYREVFGASCEPESASRPNFDDYFTELNSSSISSLVSPGLLFESSTGCWFGEKSHCTFCGLNGVSMKFRSREPEDVLSELISQRTKYGINKFEAVDNILDMSYFKTLLPMLSEDEEGFSIFYETKSNLREEHIKLLRKSGVSWIQPGIESLSTPVLKRLKKGNSTLSNIYLLKKSYEHGVRLSWSILIGDPRELEYDYQSSVDLIPLIYHLQPPGNLVRIRFDRFSPYFEESNAHGLNLSPFKSYGYVYPKSTRLEFIAYFFEDHDLERADVLTGAGRELVEQFLEWQRVFYCQESDLIDARLCFLSDYCIYDSRFGEVKKIEISHEERVLLLKFDSPTLKRSLQNFTPEYHLALNRLQEKKFVYEEYGQIISLVVTDKGEVMPEMKDFPGGYFDIW